MSTLASPARPVKAKKKDRTACVLSRFDNGLTLVEITERGPRSVAVSLYYVSPFAADYGRAFLFQGVAAKSGSRYCVNVGDKDSAPSCECKGHLQHGHKTVCRHLACVRALIAAGKLDDAPTAGKPAPCPHDHVFRADDGELCCANCSADLS